MAENIWRENVKASDKTLRDEFAMVAMNGFISSIPKPDVSLANLGKLAVVSYQVADAMLKARLV